MSDLFTLVKSDYIKGGVMFVLSSVITALAQMIQSQGFSIDWNQVLIVASISTLSYIGKQLGTEVRPSGEFLMGKYKM